MNDEVQQRRRPDRSAAKREEMQAGDPNDEEQPVPSRRAKTH
jgi:hypothetical protein